MKSTDSETNTRDWTQTKLQSVMVMRLTPSI